MINFRENALVKTGGRLKKNIINKEKASSIFAHNVFTIKKMRHYLSASTYKQLLNSVYHGHSIGRDSADEIASAMKAWALEHRATHYTHWFHPLNEASAEKHDAFLDVSEDESALESFSGDELVQQEPDASSFPNGGLRDTFEARGYTAWDPSSPAFIKNNTLFIPTVFVTYTGHALDYKTPLLKSLYALDKSATAVCQYFDKNVRRVITNLGWEQEYFLIDEALFYARPDLVLTGRSLMGHASAKDQQLDDHYLGSIPDRVLDFMQDLENESYKLGIPIITRHNEVAPSQFEFAPKYEEASLAIDHNQLLISLMTDVARRHHFVVLFHEKPFKKINGSGKHNNFSMCTDTGVNLLSPGKNPKTNLQFLVFLINTIMAVSKHSDLLRASIVSAGNEHRLGAAEAPPAIMSVFLGTYLSRVLDDIETMVDAKKRMTPEEKTALKLNVGKIPSILLDNTDRNRTSPFAFTGNRFEFRAVGASTNCSAPITVLSAAVSQQLDNFKIEVDSFIERGIKKDEAIFKVLRSYIIASKAIRFDGNGYSQDWEREAARRGLSNVPQAVEALKAYLSKDTIRLFKDTGVLSEVEVRARYDIKNEIYSKKIQIESRVLGDLAINHIVPTAIRYQNVLLQNITGLKEVYDYASFESISAPQKQTVKKLSHHINAIRGGVSEMVVARKKANAKSDVVDKAILYSEIVKPYLEEIRYHIDKLELLVDNAMWPLPKYRELLFLR